MASTSLALLAAICSVACDDGDPTGPTVTQVEVNPREVTFSAIGASHRFEAIARDANGPVATTMFTWTSSNVDVAAVDSMGVAEAVGNGSARIAATAGGASGWADVTVRQSIAAVTVRPASRRGTGDGSRLARPRTPSQPGRLAHDRGVHEGLNVGVGRVRRSETDRAPPRPLRRAPASAARA